MTRRNLLQTLTATGLLAALPCLPQQGKAEAVRDTDALVKLRKLSEKLASVRAEKEASIAEHFYECAAMLRNSEKKLQEQIADYCATL